jgi:hypothetical protein
VRSARIFFILVGLLGIFTASAQDKQRHYFISANFNLHVPFDKEKGMYPILWYNKETTPKIQLGGLGVGITVMQPYREKINFQGQANLSRHVHWDESIDARSTQNQSEGVYPVSEVDYTLGITGTMHYEATPNFSIGTGLGLQVMLLSFTRLNDLPLREKHAPVRNRFYKPVVPTAPVEFTWHRSKTIFTVRYEHALFNRLKKELAEYEKDKFGLLFLEMGFKIK